MREVYRKFGRVVRYEHGTTIDVSEAGEAIETTETFIATPIRERVELPEPDLPHFNIQVERLVLSHGFAVHQFNDIEWSEETRRLHVALTNGKLRARIDLEDFDFDLVRDVAARLQRAGAERESPERVRLAPHVAAALMPHLPGELWQRAGGRDGKGQLIDEVPAAQSKCWYRPSYRVRPIRKALNLTVRSERTDVDVELPRAIAIIDDGLLIDDGRDVYPAFCEIAAITAVAPDGEIESRCRWPRPTNRSNSSPARS